MNDQQPRASDIPEPGTFKCRMVRGGPWVGACVHVTDTGMWAVDVNGKPAGTNADPWQIEWMQTRYFYALRITAEEYAYLISIAAWAEANDPNHPAANPTKPIELRAQKPLF